MASNWVWDSRPTLTIWVYDSARGAAAGEVRLRDLARRGAVSVVDAVTVTWVRGTHRPRAGRSRGWTRHEVAREGVLARLAELLVGPEEGPGGPARLSSLLTGTGVDEVLLDEVVRELVPDSSALLVLSTDVDLDVVRPIVERGRARGDVVVLHAYLTPGGIDLMRAALGGPGTPGGGGRLLD